MIIDGERPQSSIYYIASIILEVLYSYNKLQIDALYEKVKDKCDNSLYVDDIYYSLDWLYILSLIRINEDMVELCE